MKYKDYYKILGVERTATKDQIKRAYRRLARKYHPDVSKEKNAEEQFKEVSEAYEVLHDRDKRAAYDQMGSFQAGQEFRPPPNWGERFGQGGFSNPDGMSEMDLFDLLAGLGRGGFAGRGASRDFSIPGHDTEVAIAVRLEDLDRGAELEISLPMQPAVLGAVSNGMRKLKVRIPKGATEGQRLRVPGKGEPGRGGAHPGDLYLVIAVQPHPVFRVAGHDLYVDVPIAPWEAVLGADVHIPVLAGKLSLKIPAGSKAGQRLRVRGKGLSKPGGEAGDLLAVLQLALPEHSSEPEKQLYRQLAETSTFSPRAHFK